MPDRSTLIRNSDRQHLKVNTDGLRPVRDMDWHTLCCDHQCIWLTLTNTTLPACAWMCLLLHIAHLSWAGYDYCMVDLSLHTWTQPDMVYMWFTPHLAVMLDATSSWCSLHAACPTYALYLHDCKNEQGMAEYLCVEQCLLAGKFICLVCACCHMLLRCRCCPHPFWGLLHYAPIMHSETVSVNSRSQPYPCVYQIMRSVWS